MTNWARKVPFSTRLGGRILQEIAPEPHMSARQMRSDDFSLEIGASRVATKLNVDSVARGCCCIRCIENSKSNAPSTKG